MKDFDLELEKAILKDLEIPHSDTFYTTISLEGRDRAEVAKILKYHNKKYSMYQRSATVQLRDKIKSTDFYWAGATYIPFGILFFVIAIPTALLFHVLSWSFVFKTIFWIVVGYFAFNGLYGIQLLMEYRRINQGKYRE